MLTSHSASHFLAHFKVVSKRESSQIKAVSFKPFSKLSSVCVFYSTFFLKKSLMKVADFKISANDINILSFLK